MACACKGTIGFFSQKIVSKCSVIPGRIVSFSTLHKLNGISTGLQALPYQRFRHFSISTTRWKIVATGSSAQDVAVEPIVKKPGSDISKTFSHGQDEGQHEEDEGSDSDTSGESSDEDESGGFKNEHLIKLSPLQRAIITVGSGLSSFFDPTRAENIATFGEISAGLVINRLYQNMMENDEARRILTQKPRINSKTIDLEYLAKLPEGTLGWAYIQFLKTNNVTPDSRLPVRFIEDPELAYVMQRYREVHDLVHTVTGQPTNMLGEVVVKWIEGIQTGLPMCVTGGLFGATRLRPKQRQRYLNSHLKWAIDVGFTSKPFLDIYYEERWEQPLHELQYEICPKLLSPP